MAWEHGRVRFFGGKVEAPTVDDDENLGFRASDLWLDELGVVAYRCLSASAGNAFWQEEGGGGSPVYLFIKALGQSEGNIHLSQVDWGVNKAYVSNVSVITSSSDWDLYLLQNDNGFIADDANITKLPIMLNGNGNANLFLDLPYEDEDESEEVHLYYRDNSGSALMDIYVRGLELG